MTGRYVRALSANAGPGPAIATMIPASAGPSTRARLNISEFSAIAFAMCSRPDSATTKL